LASIKKLVFTISGYTWFADAGIFGTYKITYYDAVGGWWLRVIPSNDPRAVSLTEGGSFSIADCIKVAQEHYEAAVKLHLDM
jgi:hypothetical protein